MVNSKARDRQLLVEMLAVLVRSFGHAEVKQCLLDIGEGGLGNRAAGDAFVGPSKPASPRKKPSPVEMVERSNIPEPRRSLLLRLARNFEQKRFLPSIGDVRHFLEMRGQDSSGLVQRPEAFRRLLETLQDMQGDALARLVTSEKHSGPSDLQGLSDAIRFVGGTRASAMQSTSIEETKAPASLPGSEAATEQQGAAGVLSEPSANDADQATQSTPDDPPSIDKTELPKGSA